MKAFREMTLEKRLVYAFLLVVLVCSFLSAAVFTVFLVDNIRKSTKEKISETLKIVQSKVDETARNLETYADLISSDINFGQLLSFDSASGIQNKIDELSQQSHADAVLFIPKPMHYVQIKDAVFSSLGDDALKAAVKQWVLENGFLESGQRKGWIRLAEVPHIFSAKAVSYFGTVMGTIILLKRPTQEFVESVSQAAGAQVALLGGGGELIHASIKGATNSLDVPKGTGSKEPEMIENLKVENGVYTALLSPILDYQGSGIGRIALLTSNASIREAQRRTLYSAAIAAVLTLILSTFLGYLLAGAVAKPIRSITASIREISEKSDLSIRVPQNAGAEIGILSGAFNRLLEKLQDTTEKLAQSERRMKHELTTASTVQEMLFPQKKIDFPRIALASHISTSSETGGDWFGYAHSQNQDKVSVLIGDVTGHGMPAALVTAITNGFFKGASDRDIVHPDRLLARLNDILIESTHKSLLMTFFASVFDPASRTLTYANAGHLRPLLCRKKDGTYEVKVLPSDPGQRLGEELGTSYTQNEFQLEPDDLVIWYTDGILDCTNPNEESFGKRRFLKCIKDTANQPVEGVVTHIVSSFDEFSKGHPPVDDITVVAARIG